MSSSHSILRPRLRCRAYFKIAILRALMAVLFAAFAASAQQNTSTEDAKKLLSECGTRHRHGEVREALAICESALSKFRATGDRRGEAVILNNIGSAHSDLGEQQRALEYYQMALPI